MDRRHFLAHSGLAGAATILGCGGGSGLVDPPKNPDPDPGPPGALPEGVTVAGNIISIEVARVPALQIVPGFFAIAREQTLVLLVGVGAFRAFTNVCTHAGCGINGFARERMRCPCHGSEYDLTGRVVQGPAELPLKSFATTFETASGRLVVTKS